MVIAADQRIGDTQEDAPQTAVGATCQAAVGMIDLVALIANGKQTCAPRDGPSVEVMFDGAHFAGELGGPDDINAGNGQQEDVRSLRQVIGQFAFQCENFQGFSLVIVEGDERQTTMHQGGRLPGRCLSGPTQNGLNGGKLEVNFLATKPGTDPCAAGLQERLGRGEVAEERESYFTIPQFAEEGAVARPSSIEMLADLASQERSFTY